MTKKRKKKLSWIKYLLLFIFAILAVTYFYIKSNLESASSEISFENIEPKLISLSKGLEVPLCPAKNHVQDHEIRKFRYYSLCYRESYEQAEWSAYTISDSDLIKNAVRSNNFRPDGEISTQSASLSDYKGSDYDRGHLTPAADMAFSEEAMSETFFMSNMSPQTPQFNRGIWKDLEAEVRYWTKVFGKVFVVSGPVLDKPSSFFTSIGENQVSVPEFYYKVILVPLYEDETDRASPEDSKIVMTIGFIIPNKKCEQDFWNYAVPVDQVEALTHIDFYSLLPDNIEDSVEAKLDLDLWR